MALPSVPSLTTFPAGSRITTSRWQGDITDPVTFLTNPPVFQGDQSAAQSIPNNAVTSLSIDNSITDPYAGHSNVTNNSRWTCPSGIPGWFVVVGYFGLAANATGVRLARILKNGSAVPLGQSDQVNPTAAVTLAMQTLAVVQLAVGDFVEISGFQTSGGALNTVTTDTGMALWFLHG